MERKMEELFNRLMELEHPKASTNTGMNKKKIIKSTKDLRDFYRNNLKTFKKDLEIESYLTLVGTLKKNSNTFLEKITLAINILKDLQGLNEFISEKTRDLQSQTSKIIREEEDLVDLANDLELKLSYFNSLEMVMKLLSSSGGEITQEKDFIPSLSLLDHCSEFLSRNLDYKESGVYFFKTKQCMTRSMMLIKMHVVNSLRTLAADIRDLLVNDSSNMQISLFYTKFKNLGMQTKSLISELESRAVNNLEFINLLKDSVNVYFDTRKSLIGPYILKNIQEMKQDSILEYSKIGCAYMIQICEDEFKLFHEFYELEHEELG